MEIELIATKQGFISLADQWNCLLKNSSNDQVYLTHDWFHCWWNAFGDDKRPFVLLIKDKDRVMGIAPLLLNTVTYRNIFKIKEVGFWVNDISPRIEFICHSGAEQSVIAAIIEYLFKNTESWDVFTLAKIPENSSILEILLNILKDRHVIFKIDKSVQSPTLSINTDWETYYATRTSKFRKGMRNKINRIQKNGTYQVEKVNNPTQLQGIFPVISDIAARSWKQHMENTFPTNRNQVLFYEELTKIGGNKGWVNIWLLKYNGQYIAFEYHLVYGKTIHTIRGDYDEAYKTMSPGSYLEYNIIKHHFDHLEQIEYDFCGDNYQYMLNWTDNVRDHVSMRLFNKNFLSRAVATADCRLIPYLKKINKRFNHSTRPTIL